MVLPNSFSQSYFNITEHTIGGNTIKLYNNFIYLVGQTFYPSSNQGYFYDPGFISFQKIDLNGQVVLMDSLIVDTVSFSYASTFDMWNDKLVILSNTVNNSDYITLKSDYRLTMVNENQLLG